MQINLGCGHDHKPGWLNVDIDARVKPDLVADVSATLPMSNACVSRVLLQDVLEHLTLEQGRELFLEIRRILEEGGELVVRVPSVALIIKEYGRYPDLVFHFLYGNTRFSGVWGAHKVGYDKAALRFLGQVSGLELVAIENQGTNLVARYQARNSATTIHNHTGSKAAEVRLLAFLGDKAIGTYEIRRLSVPMLVRQALFPSRDLVGVATMTYVSKLERIVFRRLLPYLPLVLASKAAAEILKQSGYSHLRIIITSKL